MEEPCKPCEAAIDDRPSIKALAPVYTLCPKDPTAAVNDEKDTVASAGRLDDNSFSNFMPCTFGAFTCHVLFICSLLTELSSRTPLACSTTHDGEEL